MNHKANTTPDAVDVIEAKAHYKAAYQAAKTTIEELQNKLKRLDNLKMMNAYQLKDYQQTKLLIDILLIFTKSSAIVVKYMAHHEAQAYNNLAEASQLELVMLQAQQQRIEQLKKEVADLNELLNMISDQFLTA